MFSFGVYLLYYLQLVIFVVNPISYLEFAQDTYI